MGQWNISIHGTGSHHNKGNPTDANKLAAAFVKTLEDAGHTITRATITFGGEEDITNSVKYLEDKAHFDAGT